MCLRDHRSILTTKICKLAAAFAFIALAAVLIAAPAPGSFDFVLFGDRTGGAQPGIYERIWQAAAAEKPEFVISAGDLIEGGDDATAENEWRKFEQMLAPYRKFPFYTAPGNHDIWSPTSEQLFRKYAGHPPHYGFDYKQVHFTVLDNSRSDQLSEEELHFLEQDLQSHAGQPVKFILSHRPSWLIDAAVGNSMSPLHQLAKKYGVKYVLAGHIHQMLHLDFDGVSYVSLPSAGGHLRLSGHYEDGWFFAHTVAHVHGAAVDFEMRELEGRSTSLKDWGMLGLLKPAGATSILGR